MLAFFASLSSSRALSIFASNFSIIA